MKPDPDDYLPLAPATLHILLSLAGEPMHGYGIMQEVLRQSDGRYNLGPGTLYDNLQRLMKQRMVEEVAGPSGEENSRRRYYRLSSLGRGVLSQEITRLEEVVNEGQNAPPLAETEEDVMLRWLYMQLIWLHPAPFRWRFGDQMLDIFDGAARRAKLRYLADAVASLGRQWLLRPEFQRPEAPAADASLETAGVPLFQTIETYKPHPSALLQGGLLAILSIAVVVVLIGREGGIARPFLVGSHFSKPSLLPIDRNSLTGSDLNTTVKAGPDPFEAWLKLARPYFASMPVLRTLDADRDLAISAREIGNAPAALRMLDADHNGKLTAEECGLHIDPNSMSAAALAQLRRRFMSFHPVLAALDADHDGEISAWEMEHAAAALKNLDRNHDRYLTADELIPFEMAAHAGLR